MTSVDIPMGDFPAIDSEKEATWAAIICRPKQASWEQFVVGIVAVDGDGFHIEAANRLSRLGCLYDERAMPIILSVEIAISWLEEVLSSGVKKLSELDFPVENISFGDCQTASGLSCREISELWMGSLSSFYEKTSNDFALKAAAVVEASLHEVERQPLRLPVQVLGIIEKKNTALLEYFHEDVRSRSTRRVRANARIKIDYDGPRLSANIDRFNVDAPSSTVGTLKQRMWDLAIQRDKSTKSTRGSKAFEMLVDFPKYRMIDKRPKSISRIQDHLHELTQQADREEIRLRTLSGAREIGEHILLLESAV